MRILTVDNEADLAVLRSSSTNFNVADLNTAAWLQSSASTRKAPPSRCTANIVIEEAMGERETGSEGCLSVPGFRGKVMRYQDITIRYTDINSDRMDQPREVREDIKGFAAVIFQHECDHLDGVIYTDKAENVVPDNG